jgi:hypothetical protein
MLQTVVYACHVHMLLIDTQCCSLIKTQREPDGIRHGSACNLSLYTNLLDS